ncbi:MAG: polyprenyl synthetase family protein [Conexivisphaerales archaeon]
MSLESEMKRIAMLVDSKMKESLTGEPELLYSASSHLIQAGGKRLRPLILMKFYSLYRDDEVSVLPLAAALELVHNFTLIHDDIMDNDDMRRGVPTTHRKYGVPMAILAGDVLFAKVFSLVSETPALQGDARRMKEAVRVVAESLVTICEGQALDLNPPPLSDFTEEFYFGMIKKKTSALFEASALLGCIAAGSPSSHLDLAERFARHLGLAFQIVDDVLGVVGEPEVTGKPVGGDIRQGKRTLPIVMAFRKADRREQELLLSVWGVRDAPEKKVKEAVDFIRSSGVEEAARSLASQHLSEALKALEGLPQSSANETLKELANFLTVRRM